MRALVNFLSAIVAAFALTFLLASALPLAFGDRTFVVRSGSMAPQVDTGDVVAVAPITATEARVGDIVTFDNHGKFTQHRARAIRRNGTKLDFTTQGDANTGQEHWSVAADGKIGRVVYRVPRLGFVVARMQSPAARIVLIAVPALLLGVTLLRRIWQTDPVEEQARALAG